MRVRWMAAWSAAAALAAVGCGSTTGGYGSGGTTPPPCTAANATAVTRSIELSGMAFVPACAKLTAGTGVTFTNDDATLVHTVTSDAGQAETFDSGSLVFSAEFVHTFATPTTEHIHCNFHPNMHLTVFVQ